MNELKKTGSLSPGQTAFLWLLPVVTAVLALGVGRLWISPAEIFQSISARLGSGAALSAKSKTSGATCMGSLR